MATVRSQMGGDAVGAGAFANSRDRDWIWLSVLRIRHGGVARLPESCNVININTELKGFHGLFNRLQRRRTSKFF
jgi:hypothetical protein